MENLTYSLIASNIIWIALVILMKRNNDKLRVIKILDLISKRISLSEDDFKTIVTGGIVNVKKSDIKIMLQDIGYDRMLSIIQAAKCKDRFCVYCGEPAEKISINMTTGAETPLCPKHYP